MVSSSPPVMQRIGQHIRRRREFLNLSQKSLAQDLGVTSQQIQKYESGSNMISAVRLYHVSHILKVSLAFFFEDPPLVDPQSVIAQVEVCPPSACQEPSPLYQESLDLVKAFLKIQDPNMRSKILGLTQDLSQLKR